MLNHVNLMQFLEVAINMLNSGIVRTQGVTLQIFMLAPVARGPTASFIFRCTRAEHSENVRIAKGRINLISTGTNVMHQA